MVGRQGGPAKGGAAAPRAGGAPPPAGGVDRAGGGLGPVPAVRQLFEKTRLTMKDIELVEVNEAFAAQVLACHRELEFDLSRVNVNGGAIALGPPVGATRARITVTLRHEMRRRQAPRGPSTHRLSSAQGTA